MHIALNEALADATARGGVRHFVVIQENANEPDKGKTVVQGFFHHPVGEVVPALKQKDFEHWKQQICRIAYALTTSLSVLRKIFSSEFQSIRQTFLSRNHSLRLRLATM